MEATPFLLKETQNFTQRSHTLYISVGVWLRARLHWERKIVGVDLPAIEELYNTLFAPPFLLEGTLPLMLLHHELYKKASFFFLLQCADWRTPVFPCMHMHLLYSYINWLHMHLVYFHELSCPLFYHFRYPDWLMDVFTCLNIILFLCPLFYCVNCNVFYVFPSSCIPFPMQQWQRKK